MSLRCSHSRSLRRRQLARPLTEGNHLRINVGQAGLSLVQTGVHAKDAFPWNTRIESCCYVLGRKSCATNDLSPAQGLFMFDHQSRAFARSRRELCPEGLKCTATKSPAIKDKDRQFTSQRHAKQRPFNPKLRGDLIRTSIGQLRRNLSSICVSRRRGTTFPAPRISHEVKFHEWLNCSFMIQTPQKHFLISIDEPSAKLLNCSL